MERSPATSGGGCNCQVTSTGGLTGPGRAGQEGHQRDLSSSIQIRSSALSGGADRMGDLSDLHLSPPGGLPHMECTSVMDRTSLVAYARLSPEGRQATIRCIDGQSVELCLSTIPSLRMLLQVSLHNDTSLCYLNSTALAATWTLLQVQLHGLADLSLAPALRRLCRISYPG